jgi:hypothetical protein
MKKTNLLFVTSSLLVLAACGQTGSLLPSGGTSVEQAKAIEQLDTAIKATGSADAIGVKLSGFNLSASCDLSIPAVTNVEAYDLTMASSLPVSLPSAATVSTLGISGSLDIKNVNASLMAKGLTSKTVDDIAFSAKVSGGVKANVSLSAGVTKSLSFDYSSVSAAAYIAQNTAYADFSDDNFVSLVNTIASFSSSLDSSVSTSETSKKTLTKGKYILGSDLFNAENLPLLSQDDLTNNLKTISDTLTANSAYFKSYTYSNGNYALDFSFSKEALIALVKGNVSKMSSTAAEAVNAYADFINKNLTINACQEVLVYNDKGLISNSCNIDISFATTLGDIAETAQSGAKAAMGDTLASKVEKGSFKLAYSLAFLKGIDVVVESPSDTATYTSSNPFLA